MKSKSGHVIYFWIAFLKIMASVLENNIQFGIMQGLCTHDNLPDMWPGWLQFEQKFKMSPCSPSIPSSFCHPIVLLSFNSFLSFLLLLSSLHFRGRKSAITSRSDADLRSERDTGEILDTLLLLHVLCGQLLWKGIYWQA